MDNVTREKLRWRSTRRALLEIDIYFNRFIQNGGLDKLTNDEVEAYQALLECEDSDLLVLFLGKDVVDDKIAQSVVDKIRFIGNII